MFGFFRRGTATERSRLNRAAWPEFSTIQAFPCHKSASLRPAGSLFPGGGCLLKIMHSADEGGTDKCLGEIAEHLAGPGIALFGKKAQVVGVFQGRVNDRAGASYVAHDPVLGDPEGAGQKVSLFLRVKVLEMTAIKMILSKFDGPGIALPTNEPVVYSSGNTVMYFLKLK